MNLQAVPTVFGADEQRDVLVDVARWVRLAQLVLDEERVIVHYENLHGQGVGIPVHRSPSGKVRTMADVRRFDRL